MHVCMHIRGKERDTETDIEAEEREESFMEPRRKHSLTFLQISPNSSRPFQKEAVSKCLQLLVEVFDLVLGDLSHRAEMANGYRLTKVISSEMFFVFQNCYKL